MNKKLLMIFAFFSIFALLGVAQAGTQYVYWHDYQRSKYNYLDVFNGTWDYTATCPYSVSPYCYMTADTDVMALGSFESWTVRNKQWFAQIGTSECPTMESHLVEFLVGDDENEQWSTVGVESIHYQYVVWFGQIHSYHRVYVYANGGKYHMFTEYDVDYNDEWETKFYKISNGQNYDTVVRIKNLDGGTTYYYTFSDYIEFPRLEAKTWTPPMYPVYSFAVRGQRSGETYIYS